MEDLPDDLLLEILARVTDVAALFRCATTCNRWRRLVADPTFLRRRWPDKASSSLIGFFALGWHDEYSMMGRGIIPVPPVTTPAFVPVPPSLFGPGDLFSLLPKAVGLLDRPVVVASGRGLLLLRFYPHGAPVDQRIRLAVGNLLAGTCDVLPPLNFNSLYGVDFNGYAIMSGADFCSDNDQLQRLPLFQVVVASNRTWNPLYNFHIFSSDQLKWSSLSSYDGITKLGVYMQQRTAVVRWGTAHWLFRDTSSLFMVDVNTMTGHISIEKLKIPPVKNFIRLNVDAEGMLRLYYFCSEDSSLQIWRRQDHRGTGDGSSDWIHIQTIQLALPKRRQNIDKLNPWMSLGEKSGMWLFVTHNRCAYIIHIQTGVMETVTSWFSGLNCETAVRVEIDWPELFMSALQPRPKLT